MKQMLILALLGWSFSVLAQKPTATHLPKPGRMSRGLAGGITPTGSVMSLDGMIDADGDGNGEFLMSSSWSGAFGNDAIFCESFRRFVCDRVVLLVQQSGSHQLQLFRLPPAIWTRTGCQN
ncbi:MAG: hypothetical protein R3C26_18095 [Calditrichia bacterium]